jgi:ABC-type amino acid transport substrate-binding protein
MSRILSALLLAVLVALLPACHGQPGKDLLGSMFKTQPLRVGIAVDAPPLAMKKDSRITGLEPQFAQGLAQSLQRPLELVELPRGELAGALLERKIDIVMAAMSVAEAQRQKLATSDPYLISGQSVLVRLDDFKRFGYGTRNLGNAQVRLGVITDSPGERLLTGLHPKGTVSRYANGPEGLRALLTDRIDVLIHDFPANAYYASLFLDRGLTPGVSLLTREPLAWAIHPTDNAMRKAANSYLDGLERSGALATMLDQAIPFYRDTAYSPRQ